MSGPVPSPSMNGMIGSSGTCSFVSRRVIAVPFDGGVSEVKLGIVVPESFRSGPPNAAGGSQQKLWKTLWKRLFVSTLLRANWNVSANCIITGRARRHQLRDGQNHGIIL